MLDQIAQTPHAEPLTKRLHGIADGRRVAAGTHGRRARQVKQHAYLAEVIPRPGNLDQFLTAVGQSCTISNSPSDTT
ncbi:hypothetical protein ROJ27_00085 [Mycobacterium tuberculosis variant bovis]|nr:glutamine ABC transporter ATP-binding protein [Mycobacterium tuberculosis variant bovis]CKP69575.1 Uncharacterised protein [Mycobacterium tuberculosis]CKW89860.1 Uncharacterised protein [Mycobacterium tuberculosis]CKX67848.1 Uncharacterised protein [Mycobacterium tuberculosis]